MLNFVLVFSIISSFVFFISTPSYAATKKPQKKSAAKTEDRSLAIVEKKRNGNKRIALVIGNGNYQYSDIMPVLANPTHDAEDISAALRGFGFDVIEKKNQSLEGMSDAITEFSRKIGDSEAALFYYAGHALQVKGQNYLIPVNAKIDTEAQVSHKSINVNLILDEMDNGNSRFNIVMLDACRNNPLTGKFRSSASRGLAALTNVPKGTIVVYATAAGNVAADGDGRNGLFTAGLLKAFKGSDLSLGKVLEHASEEVDRVSNQKQTPYIYGPPIVQKNFYFAPNRENQTAALPSAPEPAQSKQVPRMKNPEEIEQETWESARDSNNQGAIEEYLKQYPNGRFSGQARVLIAAKFSKPVDVEAQQLAQKNAQEKAAKLADFSYFENANRLERSSDPSDKLSSPLGTAFDILSLPSKSSEMEKIKNQAVLRPSTWAKPDSMIARASSKLKTNRTWIPDSQVAMTTQ